MAGRTAVTLRSATNGCQGDHVTDDEDEAAASREANPAGNNEANPAGNKIALDQGLVEAIRQSHNKSREGIIEVAEKAYALRMQYLREDGKRYAAEFEGWWQTYKLKDIFGSRSNFTKYANAGEALKAATIDKYKDRLPITLTALDEVSHMTKEEILLCLENRYTRSAVGADPKAPKTASPVIYPNATAGEVKGWLKRWRNPTADGTAPGDKLTLDELAEIEKKVTEALEPYNGYELANEIKKLMQLKRKRIMRAEEKLAKKKSKSTTGSRT